MLDLTRDVFETLRSDQEFVLYRGRSIDDGSQVLILSPATVNPGPITLRRLEHEYSLRGELDRAWAARPIAIARHRDRTVLVLEDPGGVPLESAFVSPGRDRSAFGSFCLRYQFEEGSRASEIVANFGRFSSCQSGNAAGSPPPGALKW